MNNNFSFYNLQFVYFLSSLNILDRSKLMAQLKEELKGTKEIIFPIPDDAPADFPFMILNKPGSYEIKIAKGRIDVNFETNNSDKTKFKEILEKDFFEFNIKLFNVLEEITDFKIKDVGFIIRSIKNKLESENINQTIKMFFSDNTLLSFDNDSDILIRNLKKEKININDRDIQLNNIILLNTIFFDKNKDRFLLLEFDRNTFPKEELLNFDKEFVNEFIKKESKDYLLLLNNISSFLQLKESRSE